MFDELASSAGQLLYITHPLLAIDVTLTDCSCDCIRSVWLYTHFLSFS